MRHAPLDPWNDRESFEMSDLTFYTPRLQASSSKGTSYSHTIQPPDMEIRSCISFQKFRYCGENRPGKRHQEKEFLTLPLRNMAGKKVTVQIVCLDASRPTHILHPNRLVGKDCAHGVYTRTYNVYKTPFDISIPYLRVERIPFKKTANEQERSRPTMRSAFEERSKILPSPYRDWCLQQMEDDKMRYDTTKVRLGVIATVDDFSCQPLFCYSHVIQNARETTTLSIQRLSSRSVSAMYGGELDIFTSEDGPDIVEEKCTIKVVVCGESAWESSEFRPTKEDILYKRVVRFPVPEFEPNPGTAVAVEAIIQLSCQQSGQSSNCCFTYEPNTSCLQPQEMLATPHYSRRHAVKFTDEKPLNVNLRGNTKMKRQRLEDAELIFNLHRPGGKLTQGPASKPCTLTTTTPAATVNTKTGVPVYEQDNTITAVDCKPEKTNTGFSGFVSGITGQHMLAGVQNARGFAAAGATDQCQQTIFYPPGQVMKEDPARRSDPASILRLTNEVSNPQQPLGRATASVATTCNSAVVGPPSIMLGADFAHGRDRGSEPRANLSADTLTSSTDIHSLPSVQLLTQNLHETVQDYIKMEYS